MNIEVVELIAKANKIISATGNGVGTKYPKSLKNIVVALRLEHNISIKELVKHIPISVYSAREWPKQFGEQQSFKKVIVNESSPKKAEGKVSKRKNQMDTIILSLKILIALITLLIFELIFLLLI